MKLRLLILLAAALAASPAAGQTVKSLGYNTTNGFVTYSGSNSLTFTNSLQFATNARAATRTNLELGATWLTNTNVTNFRTAVGLGTSNDVTFSNITASGIITAKDSTASPATNSTLARGIQWTNLGGGGVAAIYGSYPGVPQIYLAVGATNALTDVATFRATGMTVNSNAIVGGTLAVSNAATFATNVTVNGNISVGSLTTTTPSTWALDATQTAAATNGILALPSNANVIRLTNNNAISSVTNGVLGAFYYLVNQATNAVTISNVGGITVDGAQNLTLSPNESATIVATGATNASVAARGDLTDVALGGTANTAPSQTASSGSSLMTRGLSDLRYLGEMFSAAPMDYYGPAPAIVNFREARVVEYTNAQGQGPFMWALLDPNKYAGKTVRVVAYCRVNSTNGGIVAGLGRVHYLTNISGGSSDPSFSFSPGGDGLAFGVLPSSPTQYNDFNVGNSTNSYVVLTNHVGTIPTNSKLIGVSFGFDRSLTNNTFTNTIYLQAVQVVVENP